MWQQLNSSPDWCGPHWGLMGGIVNLITHALTFAELHKEISGSLESISNSLTHKK